MCNEKEAYFKPKMGEGRENPTKTENSRELGDMEATRQTRPHFRTLEEAHAYFKELDKAKQADSSSITFKRLKDYHDYNIKAQEAIIQLREGIKASMGIAYIPNQITLKNGDYNPNYVEWLEGSLTNSALSLCEILTYDSIDDKEGYIAVWKEKAQELIKDMQYS